MATLDDVISIQQQGVQYLGLIYKALLSGPPAWQTVPATATSTGTAGQVAYDATHLYVCVATNTWVRVALATF
jgi:hypothetical protein